MVIFGLHLGLVLMKRSKSTAEADNDGSGYGWVGLDLCISHGDVWIRAVASHRDYYGIYPEHKLER